MKIVALAGGVGGAKLAFGLARVLRSSDLAVIVNTGDDFRHLGLQISPDLDTVMYTLAGIANRETGWGIESDSFATLEALEQLGGPSWFRLGDRDLATHLERTRLLDHGRRLTEVTAALCQALAVTTTLLPMSNDPVPTRVLTDEGELDFQDYFVRRRCEPRVSGIRLGGMESARPAPEVIAALAAADGVVFAPSNPFVSIEPILALPGLRDLIEARPAIAVSPIVGGQALKGPAAKMLAELGLDVSPGGVASRYAGVIGGFVIDEVDASEAQDVEALDMQVEVAQTVMRSDEDRIDLARRCLAFLEGVRPAAGQK